MTFLQLQTRVAEETGLNLTDDATALKAWVNAAYHYLNSIFDWPWLLKNGTIQTVADISTGTVSINAASTALTFSSAPAASVANQYMIKFTSISDDWYNISAHTGGATSATLSSAFLGTSNLSGGAYLLRKVLYSLPSDLGRIQDLRQAITKVKLYPMNISTFDYYLPDPTATGTPVYYSMFGYDTSKYWQVTLYPVPSTAMNLQTRYYQTDADLSGDSDVPLMPAEYHDVIVSGALYLFGHPYIDDTRFNMAKDRMENGIKNMKETSSPFPDNHTVLQPWDTRPTYPTARIQYPSNFPYPYGTF